jgi:hypothetical protein
MIKGPIDFERAMHGIYTRAKLEAGYNASLYLQMLHRHGGLGTAKQLINAASISEGYLRLSELGRIDLTVEAEVVDHPEWHKLFLPEELNKPRYRLRQFGYEPKV